MFQRIKSGINTAKPALGKIIDDSQIRILEKSINKISPKIFESKIPTQIQLEINKKLLKKLKEIINNKPELLKSLGSSSSVDDMIYKILKNDDKILIDIKFETLFEPQLKKFLKENEKFREIIDLYPTAKEKVLAEKYLITQIIQNSKPKKIDDNVFENLTNTINKKLEEFIEKKNDLFNDLKSNDTIIKQKQRFSNIFFNNNIPDEQKNNVFENLKTLITEQRDLEKKVEIGTKNLNEVISGSSTATDGKPIGTLMSEAATESSRTVTPEDAVVKSVTEGNVASDVNKIVYETMMSQNVTPGKLSESFIDAETAKQLTNVRTQQEVFTETPNPLLNTNEDVAKILDVQVNVDPKVIVDKDSATRIAELTRQITTSKKRQNFINLGNLTKQNKDNVANETKTLIQNLRSLSSKITKPKMSTVALALLVPGVVTVPAIIAISQKKAKEKEDTDFYISQIVNNEKIFEYDTVTITFNPANLNINTYDIVILKNLNPPQAHIENQKLDIVNVKSDNEIEVKVSSKISSVVRSGLMKLESDVGYQLKNDIEYEFGTENKEPSNNMWYIFGGVAIIIFFLYMYYERNKSEEAPIVKNISVTNNVDSNNSSKKILLLLLLIGAGMFFIKKI